MKSLTFAALTTLATLTTQASAADAYKQRPRGPTMIAHLGNGTPVQGDSIAITLKTLSGLFTHRFPSGPGHCTKQFFESWFVAADGTTYKPARVALPCSKPAIKPREIELKRGATLRLRSLWTIGMFVVTAPGKAPVTKRMKIPVGRYTVVVKLPRVELKQGIRVIADKGNFPRRALRKLRPDLRPEVRDNRGGNFFVIVEFSRPPSRWLIDRFNLDPIDESMATFSGSRQSLGELASRPEVKAVHSNRPHGLNLPSVIR